MVICIFPGIDWFHLHCQSCACRVVSLLPCDVFRVCSDFPILFLTYLFDLFFFFLRFYLFMRDTERQRHRQRKKQAPCEKPDVGLDPRTPGSWPEPKADAQPLSHPGSPRVKSFFSLHLIWDPIWLWPKGTFCVHVTQKDRINSALHQA